MIKFYKMVEVKELEIKNGEPLIISYMPEKDEERVIIENRCSRRNGNVKDYQCISSIGCLIAVNLESLSKNLKIN